MGRVKGPSDQRRKPGLGDPIRMPPEAVDVIRAAGLRVMVGNFPRGASVVGGSPPAVLLVLTAAKGRAWMAAPPPTMEGSSGNERVRLQQALTVDLRDVGRLPERERPAALARRLKWIDETSRALRTHGTTKRASRVIEDPFDDRDPLRPLQGGAPGLRQQRR